ncbi:FtsX-like permease family protein [Filibacter tadaridae]|uniref:Putative hemin transport system permease protein HrtB n=1 Tax=Filibacter tadaridae TaxID=2483811 RepID=A0A3P5XKY8_9BACL|nr:FtsX-like permease family protein [Filibacter tadaridae]VDC29426.1 FtsX-like permease family protein [Filibacter tadaridae]
MFLAWNEIKKNKLRFILITGVLMLVSYLVFFLSGLATGLQDMNRESVDKWNATAIILTAESDKSLYQSSMTLDDAESVKAKEIAVIAQMSAIAGNGDKKKNVTIFGIKEDEFIMPSVTEGNVFSEVGEVIASDALIEEGFKVGDKLQLSSTEETLTIVGFTDDARFNAAPVLYSDLNTFDKVKYGESADVNKNNINGVVIKTDDLKNATENDALEVVETETFIRNLPGYTEQNLTLNFMIYFLFVISAVIVAIFLYVLTVQKISMFGIMKAQGISNVYLSKSVIAQTFILATIGVAIGFVLTLITGTFLPSAVPVSFDFPTMLIYGVVLILVAIAGAVFSVLTIVKIDPLKAIGG